MQADPADISVDNWDPARINKWRRYRRTIAHSEHNLYDYLAPEYSSGVFGPHIAMQEILLKGAQILAIPMMLTGGHLV